jgi:uncharacterized membrane protein
MLPIPRRGVAGRVRLAVAGALALTTITMATAGATAGTRQCTDDSPHTAAPGFLLERGRYRTFDVPDARVGTSPGAINNRGQIVGSTAADVATAATAARGFLLRNGVKGPFTPLDVPGASATFVSSINDLGQIVGAYRVAVTATDALLPQPRLPR